MPLLIELPDLHSVGGEVAIPAQVVLREALVSRGREIAQDKENAAETDRRHREVVHRLVPHSQLGAGYVVPSCPSVTLALDEHRRIRAPKVEDVLLLEVTYADRNGEPWLHAKARRLERQDGAMLEVDSDLSVGRRPNALEVRHGRATSYP